VVRSAGVGLATKGRGAEERIIDIKISWMTSKLGVKPIVTFGNVEWIPFAGIDVTRLVLDTVPILVDFPHRKCFVNETPDLWNSDSTTRSLGFGRLPRFLAFEISLGFGILPRFAFEISCAIDSIGAL